MSHLVPTPANYYDILTDSQLKIAVDLLTAQPVPMAVSTTTLAAIDPTALAIVNDDGYAQSSTTLEETYLSSEVAVIAFNNVQFNCSQLVNQQTVTGAAIWAMFDNGQVLLDVKKFQMPIVLDNTLPPLMMNGEVEGRDMSSYGSFIDFEE